jgi:hypothetical protein
LENSSPEIGSVDHRRACQKSLFFAAFARNWLRLVKTAGSKLASFGKNRALDVRLYETQLASSITT